jgi:hypothetical protein
MSADERALAEINKLKTELAKYIVSSELINPNNAQIDGMRALLATIYDNTGTQETINHLIERYGKRASAYIEMEALEGNFVTLRQDASCPSCKIKLYKGEPAMKLKRGHACMFCSLLGTLFILSQSIKVTGAFLKTAQTLNTVS